MYGRSVVHKNIKMTNVTMSHRRHFNYSIYLCKYETHVQISTMLRISTLVLICQDYKNDTSALFKK